MSIVALFMLMLQGCPDPTTASELGHGPGGAGGGGGGGGTPGPGAGQPLGPPPAPGSFEVEAGTGVTISGTLAYDGEKEGVFRIDFLQQEGDAPPTLAHMLELEGPGTFSVEAPKNTGSLFVVGFVDMKGDGPSPEDPAGMITEPIVVDGEDVTDLVLTLTDAPDLGAFTPGDHQVAPTEDIAAEGAPAGTEEAEDAAATEGTTEDGTPAEEAPAADTPADSDEPAEPVQEEVEAPEDVPSE